MVAQIENAMLRMRPSKAPGRLVSWALIEGRPLTTRGQWINPLVFAGYRAAQALPQRAGAERPIYVVGTGRSGTTVLGTLFAIHRQTVFLNEPKALWHFAHGGEDIIGSYSTAAARIRLDPAEATPDRARRIARVYSCALRVGLGERVVDKYPELVFRVPFVLRLFPGARFIAILRDGVDTCSSVTDWSRRKGVIVGDEQHDWWGRDSRKWRLIVEELVPEHPDLAPLQERLMGASLHVDRAAVEWILSMREALRINAAHPEVVAIKYEDLCAAPEATLDTLVRHCDLEADPIFTAYARTVLTAAEPYRSIEIMPELVAPFRDALIATGYDGSVDRVGPRQGA